MRDRGFLSDLAEMRWTPPTRSADFEICIAADRGDLEMGEVAVGLQTALGRLLDALAVPLPELGVRIDPGLPEGTYAVRALGRPRLCGRFDVTAGEWWRCHRSAGPAGRAGVAGPPQALDAPVAPEELLVRAAEAVAWSDPGELDRLTDERVQDLVPGALTADELSPWRDALRALLRARISPRGLDALPLDPDGARPLTPSAPRLADELERPPNFLRLGADLFRRLADEQGSLPLEEQITGVVDAIWAKLGVACTPAPEPCPNDELPGWRFEVEIHGLVRATGEIPETTADWIHPITGATIVSPPRDNIAALEEVLAAQVYACLEEAAAEFIDVTWVDEHLNQQGARRVALVDVVRRLIPPARLAEVLARIADERRTLRGAGIIERLVEAGDQPAVELVLEEAEQEAALEWCSDELGLTGLVELARVAAPLTRSPTWSVTLDPDLVAGLRAAPEPGGTGDAAADVLRAVDAATAVHPEGDGALVVPLDLRPIVSELVRAQAPMLAVVTPYDSVLGQLDGDSRV